MKKLQLIFCILLTLAFNLSQAGSKQDTGLNDPPPPPVPDCDLRKIPLSKCDLYYDYIAADKELNKHYKYLIKKLKFKETQSLRETQRKWLQFREKKCEEVQVESECESLICRGVAHDMCVLELTTNRTKELEDFAKDPTAASVHYFSYDSIYPKPLVGE